MNHDNDDDDNDEKFTLGKREERCCRKMERASILLRSLILTQK